MAAGNGTAVTPPPVSAIRDDGMMDMRTPSPVQRNASSEGANGNGGSEAIKENGEVVENGHTVDRTPEVEMLSTKLVNAINYNNNLDDQLQQTRHELEQAQKELAELRTHKRETENLIATGQLVRKVIVDKKLKNAQEEVAQEKAARAEAEKSKKATEGELADLTSSLFEEANAMVAAARKDTEAVEKRNSQLRGQLNDTELLLASQQEQLQDLKTVMERLESRSEHDGGMSVPVTPVDASRTAAWDALQLSPNTANAPEVPPDHPLHFSHLLAPVLRHDVACYTDFQELLASARRAIPHSRQGSGNIHASSSTPNLASSASSDKYPSLPGAFSFGGSSANNSPSSATYAFNNTMPQQPALKESKFYKRTLLEDIEPTLRLDLAPGLSFLSRRSVQSALLSGSLVVEPFAAVTKSYGLGAVFSCALCGEARKQEPYVRKYRFRTSESEDAQRYPLCDWCLSRVRASGDFLGFLRMVRDGHWRCDDDEAVKGAWEEATRLRERMFWARIGGGVVPAGQIMRREGLNVESPESVRAIKSGRASLESIPERSAKDHAIQAANSFTERALPLSPLPPQVPSKNSIEEPAQVDGSLERPVSTGPERNPSAIARAIMGTSSGVLATGRPDATPEPPHNAVADTEAANEQLATEAEQEIEDAHLRPAETPEEATTPFEDAQTEADSPFASQQESAEADAQLQHEASQADGAAGEGRVVPTVQEPTPEALEEQPKPPANERRPSAIQARIAAMEARARGQSPDGGKKVPGGFD